MSAIISTPGITLGSDPVTTLCLAGLERIRNAVFEFGQHLASL
jgi:hypothetical protein